MFSAAGKRLSRPSLGSYQIFPWCSRFSTAGGWRKNANPSGFITSANLYHQLVSLGGLVSMIIPNPLYFTPASASARG